MNKILLILMILLSSCYSQKKATRQVLKAQSYYPVLVAKHCAGLFPVKEKISIKTELIKGKDSIINNFISVDCDSAIKANSTKIESKKVGSAENKFNLPCPPSISRVDTFYKSEYKEIEVTARIVELTAKYNQSTIDKAIVETKLKTANKWLKIAIGVIVLMVGFKLARTYFKF